MASVILDCYTDEPSGLGVPPYLGTYPRYIAGALDDYYYITIDDLRLWKRYKSKAPEKSREIKTSIKVYNLTKNYKDIDKILANADEIIIIAGVHTPGKYLSAVPGTLYEIIWLLEGVKCTKILTGPAAYGSRLEGGKFEENVDLGFFDEVNAYFMDINSYSKIKQYAVKGASILDQISYPVIAEIETGKGCTRKPGCSFCLEPIKNRLEFREQKDIIEEVEALRKNGVKNFRLGKQSCFYSYKGGNENEIEKLLKPISALKPDVLHIDNANPHMVNKKITELIVKYCTPGNVAAFGVESFDSEVIKQNNLNTNPEETFEAVKIINEAGAKRGSNGMPVFLPGINILLGLKGENKKTFEENYFWLKKILDENLLLRRINIRQVAVFEGTALHEECGNKYLRKNRKYYWKARNKIRREIDFPMLKKIVPEGTMIRNARAEIYDGKTTFMRQFGTYPLIVGVKQRLELNKFYDVKITSYMLRSVTGNVMFRDSSKTVNFSP